MANRYWIAGTAGSWDDTNNWSTTSGGSGGASYPVSGDDVFLDGNGVGDCRITNSNHACNNITVSSAYTGTFKIRRQLTMDDSSTFDLDAAATFEHLGKLYVSASTAWTLHIRSSGSLGGTSSASPNIEVKIKGTIQVDSGGSLTCAKGVILERDSTVANGTQIDCPIQFWGHDVAAYTKIFPASFTVTDDVTFHGRDGSHATSDFDLSTNNTSMTLQGDVTFKNWTNNATWIKGTGTITLSGTGNQTIDFYGMTLEDIDVDKSAGTATLTANVTTDSLTLTDGTLDVDANDVTTTNDCNLLAGTTIQDTTGGGSVIVGGNLHVRGTAASGCTWNGPDLDVTGYGNANFATVTNSDASAGTTIKAGSSTDSGGNTNWTFFDSAFVGVAGSANVFDDATPFDHSVDVSSLSLADGDILVAVLSDNQNNSATFSVDTETADWTELHENNGSVKTFRILWKTWNTGDATSYDFSRSAKWRGGAWIYAFRGVDTVDVSSIGNGAASTSPAANDVTTTVDDCLLFAGIVTRSTLYPLTEGDQLPDNGSLVFTKIHLVNGTQSSIGASYEYGGSTRLQDLGNFGQNNAQTCGIWTIALSPPVVASGTSSNLTLLGVGS